METVQIAVYCVPPPCSITDWFQHSS